MDDVVHKTNLVAVLWGHGTIQFQDSSAPFLRTFLYGSSCEMKSWPRGSWVSHFELEVELAFLSFNLGEKDKMRKAEIKTYFQENHPNLMMRRKGRKVPWLKTFNSNQCVFPLLSAFFPSLPMMWWDDDEFPWLIQVNPKNFQSSTRSPLSYHQVSERLINKQTLLCPLLQLCHSWAYFKPS